MTKKHPHKTYVLTWRDPNQANRNVYVTIDKRYKYCPTCRKPVDLLEKGDAEWLLNTKWYTM